MQAIPDYLRLPSIQEVSLAFINYSVTGYVSRPEFPIFPRLCQPLSSEIDILFTSAKAIWFFSSPSSLIA